ncbi:MAG: hypothetical protein H7145_03435 [Akkermansiaceae bacterium]|nr:hypothetical protein [Armatimonadota bacterium]
MRYLLFPTIGLLLITLVNTAFAQNPDRPDHTRKTETRPAEPRAALKLPPCPLGVTDLGWDDFFVSPVGRGGLRLTPKIKSLDGKRVRLSGYMVRREEPLPGVLILTPFPMSVEEHESGFADLPPQAVRVVLPYAAKEQIPHTTRPLLLTGTLYVGRREESEESASRSVSWFRLTLNTPGAPMPDKARKSEPSAKAKQ